jgi:hypothetical protein
MRSNDQEIISVHVKEKDFLSQDSDKSSNVDSGLPCLLPARNGGSQPPFLRSIVEATSRTVAGVSQQFALFKLKLK